MYLALLAHVYSTLVVVEIKTSSDTSFGPGELVMVTYCKYKNGDTVVKMESNRGARHIQVVPVYART